MATNSNNKNPFSVIVDENEATPVAKPSTKPVKENTLTDLDARQKTLAQVYSSQKRYPVRVAPSYAKHFGNNMRVVINGIAIVIRCDGGTYDIPEVFAAEVERRMREIDIIDMKSRKMGDIKNNYEPDIGRLSFF